MRERSRPVIQARLKRARTLPRLDPPMPDLDLFFDLQHPCHLEHEAGDRQGYLQRRTRACIELGRVPHEGELLFVRVPQRQMLTGLRPGEAAAYRYRPLLVSLRGPQ